jgi:hypothetical protein
MNRWTATLQHWQRVAWRSPVTQWLLLLAAIVSTTGWILRVRPIAPVWGNVAEWVGGLATALALLFAALQIRAAKEQRIAEEEHRIAAELEHREAMARAVGVRSVTYEDGGDWYVDYALQNGGEYPIDDVVVVIADPGSPEHRPEDQAGTALEAVIGTVLSKETIREKRNKVAYKREPVFGESTSLASILFTDTWGTHWAKTPLGGLIRRARPPRIC